ncbi:MAG TPA: alternative ribosome rescue aminoacyl-tRNA hydrolase ArfB, partial [Acetobacteraceae bacterium]|nr:alternative ribosome rescue aminoacyl-tRNA hydrolase ArfB [Acetobacteraceae bacterium]
MIRVTPDIAIDENAISESFVRSSGPGGQNVNKVATAVQLRFDTTSSGLPEEVVGRLCAIAGRRMTQQGELLITAQRFRTQERNRQAALDTLIALIQRAAQPIVPRVATRPTSASKRRRRQSKLHRARLKQS